MAVEKFSKVSKGFSLSAGSYPARFLGLVHLGIQKNEYEGNVTYKEQVLLRFELSQETTEDGRPLTLSKRETYSLRKGKGRESNLLKLGRALNGGKDVDEGIDWEASIGKPLQLQLKEGKTGNTSIESYAPIMKGVNLPPLVNEPQLLLDVDLIGEETFKAMPEWLQKVINERVSEQQVADDDVNF